MTYVSAFVTVRAFAIEKKKIIIEDFAYTSTIHTTRMISPWREIYSLCTLYTKFTFFAHLSC